MLAFISNGLKWIGGILQSPLLLAIRLYWGYQFLIAGFGKFLNLGTVATFFQTLEIPLPYLNAILASTTEFVCGILLLLGLFSRIASVPLLCVMFVAFITADHDSLVALFTQANPEPFFKASPFLFAYASLVVFCFGPGKISVDYWISDAHKTKEMP